jgi:hypothetical protein
VLWQVDRAGAMREGDARATTTQTQEQVSLPKLICPLH